MESCLAAQQGGAHRVELCANIPEGGTTPSYGEIKQARRLMTKTKLHVIIRPRGGDFTYSELEAERMMEDIKMCQLLCVDGVAFGCLTKDGDIDIALCQRLMEASQGMSVTFHRAFDCTRNPQQALEDIISLGCDCILTSGQQPKAEDGIVLLRKLNDQAAGRITLMAGSGVNETNIALIQQQTGICEFHFSAREPIPDKDIFGFGQQMITSSQRVQNTIRQLTL